MVRVFAPRHGMLEGVPMVKRDIALIQLPLPMLNVKRSKKSDDDWAAIIVNVEFSSTASIEMTVLLKKRASP